MYKSNSFISTHFILLIRYSFFIPADLDSSLYDPERQLNTHVIELLAKGDWIDEPNNLLITGGAGAGKTHVACALCVTALHQMRTVKYIRANYLLQESAHAHSEDSLRGSMK